MSEPRVSRVDAEDICAALWPTVEQAQEQAKILQAGGWKVEWRNPPARFGNTGRMIVASVYHPVSFESPGDVCY